MTVTGVISQAHDDELGIEVVKAIHHQVHHQHSNWGETLQFLRLNSCDFPQGGLPCLVYVLWKIAPNHTLSLLLLKIDQPG